jgi:hypothetical protein
MRLMMDAALRRRRAAAGAAQLRATLCDGRRWRGAGLRRQRVRMRKGAHTAPSTAARLCADTGPRPAARSVKEAMDVGAVAYLADWIATVEQANGGAVCVAPISVEGDSYCLNHAVSRALFGAEALAARAGQPGAPLRRAAPR